jgi:hypothetical protein
MAVRLQRPPGALNLCHARRAEVACLAAIPPNRYAYSVASISIFAGFVVSMFQCLTLDCCGMGRMVESLFDLLAAMWWIAGASTITVRGRAQHSIRRPRRRQAAGALPRCGRRAPDVCLFGKPAERMFHLG